jgi:hypothetical protein
LFAWRDTLLRNNFDRKNNSNRGRKSKKHKPVTMAVRPVASIPLVTCSAVEFHENPETAFLLNGHMMMMMMMNE